MYFVVEFHIKFDNLLNQIAFSVGVNEFERWYFHVF